MLQFASLRGQMFWVIEAGTERLSCRDLSIKLPALHCDMDVTVSLQRKKRQGEL